MSSPNATNTSTATPIDGDENPFLDPPTNLETFVHHMDDYFMLDYVPPRDYRAKRTKQWKRWQEEVLPRLVQPYLKVLRCTKNLQSTAKLDQEPRPCTCGEQGRRLKVTCIFWDSKNISSFKLNDN
ncbi:MAG: hypothetical protein ACREHG_02735 [Candidatus Saccharimonadales bacterium]